MTWKKDGDGYQCLETAARVWLKERQVEGPEMIYIEEVLMRSVPVGLGSKVVAHEQELATGKEARRLWNTIVAEAVR
jgi:hypothetical protein